MEQKFVFYKLIKTKQNSRIFIRILKLTTVICLQKLKLLATWLS